MQTSKQANNSITSSVNVLNINQLDIDRVYEMYNARFVLNKTTQKEDVYTTLENGDTFILPETNAGILRFVYKNDSEDGILRQLAALDGLPFQVREIGGDRWLTYKFPFQESWWEK